MDVRCDGLEVAEDMTLEKLRGRRWVGCVFLDMNPSTFMRPDTLACQQLQYLSHRLSPKCVVYCIFGRHFLAVYLSVSS